MDVQDPRLAQAATLIQGGKGREAIPALQAVAAEDASSYAAYNLLAMAFAQSQQFPEAIQAFQKAIALQPAQAATYFNLGVAYQKTGQVQAAVQVFSRALQLDPNHAKAAAALQALQQQAAASPPVTLSPPPVAPSTAQAGPAPPWQSPPARPAVPPRPVQVQAKTSGGASKLIIPAVAVVVIAAVAGAYFLFFASGPAKVAQAFVEAAKKADFTTLEKICSNSSKQTIALQKKFASQLGAAASKAAGEQWTNYKLGKATVEGDTAKVAIDLKQKIPTNPFSPTGMNHAKEIALKADIVLVKEEGKWKVDVLQTNQSVGMAFMNTPEGKAMMQQLQNQFKSGPNRGFGGMGR